MWIPKVHMGPLSTFLVWGLRVRSFVRRGLRIGEGPSPGEWFCWGSGSCCQGLRFRVPAKLQTMTLNFDPKPSPLKHEFRDYLDRPASTSLKFNWRFRQCSLCREDVVLWHGQALYIFGLTIKMIHFRMTISQLGPAC